MCVCVYAAFKCSLKKIISTRVVHSPLAQWFPGTTRKIAVLAAQPSMIPQIAYTRLASRISAKAKWFLLQ